MNSLSRRRFLAAGTAAAALSAANVLHAAEVRTADVFVYGSTPGGIAAALEAARRGCRVVLACPKVNAGGMTASGLCTTDAVRPEMFGGLVTEFVGRVRERHRRTLGENSPDYALTRDGWFYEPSVAEQVFDEMLGERSDRLEFWRGHHLGKAETAGGGSFP